jgi:hypothetical protein
MTLFEDDPRLKPKQPSYGGSTNRSAAPRGKQLKLETGTTPGPKKDPRLPVSRRQGGRVQNDFSKFPQTPAPETRLHKDFSMAGQLIDAGVRDIMKKSPLGAWLSRDAPSKPSLQEWLRAVGTGQRMKEFKDNREDSGIQAHRNPWSGTDPIPRVTNRRLEPWEART